MHDERLPARFWSKVRLEGTCWVWTGVRTGCGYATFRLEGRNRLGHRVAYEALVGPIPEGLELDHLCRVRHCVNPAHLEPVTGQENRRRGINTNASKDSCPAGHPYDDANTYRNARGWRYCRECDRVAKQEARDRARP